MQAPNHIVGGFTLTGTFASLFFGINILSSIPLLALTATASLLPDVDHSGTIPGRILFPIAKWTNRKYGHRTITHSIPFLVILCLLISFIESQYSNHYTFTIVFGLAYFFHILLDMFTIAGVKLMYPLQKDRIYVMIGKKELRMRTGDVRAEAIAMFIFIALGISLVPLMENGFWTTYNTYFGRPQHLVNEFQATNDLLEVNYEIKEGSQTKTGTGYCIAATTSKVVLLEKGNWTILDNAQNFIQKVIPIHTGKQFRFEATNFLAISADSLNLLLQKHPVTDIQVTSNNNFEIIQNGVASTSKKFQANYPQHLLFKAIENTIELDTFLPDQSHTPRIAALQQQIALLRAEQSQKNQLYESQQHQIIQLRQTYTDAPITQKENLIAQIRELEKVKPPSSNAPKIAHLKNQIEMLQNQAHIKNTSQKMEMELKNREKLENQEVTEFTGIITQVIVEDLIEN